MSAVPAAELAEWLEAECRRRDCSMRVLAEDAAAVLGRRAEGLERSLREVVRRGEPVDAAWADALLVALDGSLCDLPSQQRPDGQVVSAWCPGCRQTTTAGADGACGWCGSATGAGECEPTPGRYRNAGTPYLMGEDVLAEARALYMAGASMNAVASRLLDRTGYRSARSLASALYTQFARRGWPRRDQGQVTAARNHRHGHGGRDRDESAYRARLRASRAHRCEGTTAAGRQCSRSAITGERWCPAHHPDHAERRAAGLAAVRERWAAHWEPCGALVVTGERAGRPCLRRAVPGTGYCHGHRARGQEAA